MGITIVLKIGRLIGCCAVYPDCDDNDDEDDRND